MTLGIREAGPEDLADWMAFVASRPEGDVLQCWAWGEAGAGEPGERWSRLMVVDAADHVRGIAQVLDRATSFGRTVLYVPHGPLWDREAPDAAEILAHLLTGLKAHARARRGVVLKLDPRASEDALLTAALGRALLAAGARSSGHDLQAPTTRVVDLTAGSDPVAGWSKDARAEYRRAEREGTTVRLDRDGAPDLLDLFHGLLTQTSERSAFRIRSRGFLGALAEALAASGDWFLALAEHEGRPLAGAVAACTGDRAFYLYAASTRDPELAVKRGPYVAMAALQRGLREAGTKSLDLWGVREPDDPTVDPAWEGFSLFKRRFLGTPMRHPGTFDLVIDARWNRIRDLRERLRGDLRERLRGTLG
jgi:lipid II:glycine glycyltransferase (peptidoglycan interpeptide bridge formation enzyme)